MNSIEQLPEFWKPVIQVMTDLLDQGVDPWFLQTEGDPYLEGPYVQALKEHGNMILLEATSSLYLVPPLNQAQHETMLFLGWRHFPEEMYPNYSQILDRSLISSKAIAELLAKTLHFAYGVTETFEFGTIAEYQKSGLIKWMG